MISSSTRRLTTRTTSGGFFSAASLTGRSVWSGCMPPLLESTPNGSCDYMDRREQGPEPGARAVRGDELVGAELRRDVPLCLPGGALGCLPDQAQREPGHCLSRGVAGEAEVAAVGIVSYLMRPRSAGETLMAKKKPAKTETKSEFLRKALGRNPNLDHRQVNQRWAKAGHTGDISNALFYQVRAKLGIKTEWVWVKESEPEEDSTPTEARSQVYQFKITLVDTQPPVWRRIQVPDCTLGDLHEVIQTVMGWQHSHMHQFIINDEYYGEADFDDLDLGMEMKDEDGILLSQIVKAGENARFVYEYDFGDSWQHSIQFERVVEPEPKVKYPRCTEGARACPPEDCGGVWGYADFLKAIADPKHPDHRDMKEWIGGKFDPEKFSVEAVNRELKNLR